mmetsp:Transcript_1795/g.3088  ORF Transcript_1795/g.3088 Transcript_1795/m.3088 type:complete len:200 (-) Transcript_1795:223-822(-)|eukprot:CAMPEP_0198213196 /NCGR_PEP_ID=MMETSP1445-20131203/28729_1 /TAXON_ID=36898 /ORGANISM="Pyramimonas sp., Strain CCMP2087" /LENGTH=199 /DNA_ID=CAMNT_0043887807 /DNA_START=256 /DNA_END=855 /DNA_ORIENTATION=-
MVDTSDSEDEPTKGIRGKVESESTAAGEALPHWRTTHNKHCLSEDESDTSGEENDAPPDFYDSEADEEDEEWVMKQRKGRETDAILSCPCCLETLCLECQRHEVHSQQYRAMFVQPGSVHIDRTQRVRMPPEPQRMKKEKTAKSKGASGSKAASMETEKPSAPQDDAYHPVQCAVCKTEVGLYDSEDVYHFFKVFPTCG